MALFILFLKKRWVDVPNEPYDPNVSTFCANSLTQFAHCSSAQPSEGSFRCNINKGHAGCGEAEAAPERLLS